MDPGSIGARARPCARCCPLPQMAIRWKTCFPALDSFSGSLSWAHSGSFQLLRSARLLHRIPIARGLPHALLPALVGAPAPRARAPGAGRRASTCRCPGRSRSPPPPAGHPLRRPRLTLPGDASSPAAASPPPVRHSCDLDGSHPGDPSRNNCEVRVVASCTPLHYDSDAILAGDPVRGSCEV